MAKQLTDESGRATLVLSFLIADVRGYTRFTAERGDAAAALLAKRFADLARDAVEARGGRVIELRGDEALAVFESPSQAVRAAIEFQATCAEESEAEISWTCWNPNDPEANGFRATVVGKKCR